MSAQPEEQIAPPLASSPASAAADGAADDESLAPRLNAWRQRLEAAGTPCTAVAMHGESVQAQVPFAKELGPDVAAVWEKLLSRVNAEQPMVLERCQAMTGGKGNVPHLLMVARFGYGQGQTAVAGLCLPPPHSERTVQAVLLALASLQWSLTEHHHTGLLRTARLLEVLGHVASQDKAHAAAQEWVNRTAAWARELLAGASGDNAGLSLALFEVRQGSPRWWVGSDTAWAQKAAPAVLEATEQASRAVVTLDEVHAAGWRALPALAQGRATAVLVARGEEGRFNDDVLRALRSSLSMAEPLLREWRLAERPLWKHAWDALIHAVRQLGRGREHGHLRWKLGAAAALLSAFVLLGIPFDERVSAPLSIEGQTRQLVTVPFEGFVAQVVARPGERVQKGQQLLAMETRELKVEQTKYLGDREQAAGKLRQAMAEHDAAAMAQASAQLQQAQAQLDLVENKLARAVVLSPLDGLVVSGDWAQQIGAPLELGKQLFEIAAVDRYRVVLHVPDNEIARIRAGQMGELRLAGSPHRAHAFRVSLVTATASVQEGSNGFRVEADWQGLVPALSPGMQGVGKIAVGRANLLTIWTRSSIDWLRMKWWTWWW
jgi:Barrel-sandwich domain of CusB or HlyD membrane-fusion